MIKVGLFLDNRDIRGVDLSNPPAGNPGCGGTEFLIVSLAYYFIKYKKHSITPILFVCSDNNLPKEIDKHEVDDVLEGALMAKKYGCNFYIYRPFRDTQNKLLELINKLELNSILWLHVAPKYEHLRRMAECEFVKSVVCVEHEQHELLRDGPIWKKLTYIVNGFDINGFRLKNAIEKDNNLVVHLGAILPQKKFHVLAEAWKLVLDRHPEAKLKVIGSAQLYDSSLKLGDWGLAEESYENDFIVPHLMDIDGKIHPSVEFLGKLGVEKKKYLSRALIGIPNPTGDTENCPGTTIEISASGTAVVAGNKYGNLDTVLHKETGILVGSIKALSNNICKLLEDPILAKRLGNRGEQFVRERYDYYSVVNEWEYLFNCLEKNKKMKTVPFKITIFKHHKLFIYLNRIPQILFGKYMQWPSIIEIKSRLKENIEK
jgi:glycosyltransferase involved in cell wall biosynthesis